MAKFSASWRMPTIWACFCAGQVFAMALNQVWPSVCLDGDSSLVRNEHGLSSHPLRLTGSTFLRPFVFGECQTRPACRYRGHKSDFSEAKYRRKSFAGKGKKWMTGTHEELIRWRGSLKRWFTQVTNPLTGCGTSDLKNRKKQNHTSYKSICTTCYIRLVQVVSDGVWFRLDFFVQLELIKV